MALSLKVAAHSEIGLVRSNNQDSAYVSPTMIAVADGMGGAAAGDLASAVAVRELRRADEANRPDGQGQRLTGEQMLEALGGALTKANDTLADLVVSDRSLEGMGTTVCGAMFSGSQYGIAHIGDSRGYLLRAGKLRQLTHDHSWVQSLVDEGKITQAEAAEHPHRSLLLKVLNGQPTHIPDYELVDAELGDRLLFCSDGLSGMIDDAVIAELLAATGDLETIVAALTKAAHAGGGLDNITLVIADVVEHDDKLEAVTPRVLGAAQTVKIPRVGRPRGTEIEWREDTSRLPIDTAALIAAGSLDQPPAGLIDPDQFETIRYTPHLPSRRRRVLPVLATVVALLVVALAGFWGARKYVETQYFIGPDDKRVAIYRGLPEEILGRVLWSKVETSSIQVADLPPYYAGRVERRDLQYGSLDDAHEELSNLGRMAERCIAERAAGAAAPTTDSATAAPESPTIPDASATTPVSTPGATVASSSTGTPSGTATPRPDLEACG